MPIASFAMTNGVVTDIHAAAVPSNTWTDCRNIVFREGMAERARGYAAIAGPATVCSPRNMCALNAGENYNMGPNPSWLMYAGTPYAGAPLQIGRVVPSTAVHTNVTPAAWVAGPLIAGEWTSGLMNGLVYFNHPGYAPVDMRGGVPFTTLPDWVATFGANVTTLALRSYLEFYVALGTYTNATQGVDGDVVNWSARAAALTTPAVWTPAAGNAAGNARLSTGGCLVDAVPLGDVLMLYKNRSIWSMRYVGGNYIFDFKRLISGIGALSQNCVVDVGGTHFFLANRDVFMWTGSGRPTSVIDGKVRRQLDAMTDAQFAHSFVSYLPKQKEIWCCFNNGTGTSNYPNAAIVIDLDTLKCGIRSWGNANLTHTIFMHEGTTTLTGLLGDQVISYDDASAANAGRFYQVDTHDDLPKYSLTNVMTSYVYRNCLDFGAPGVVKIVKWIRPWIGGLTGGNVVLTILCGGTMRADDVVTYTQNATFNTASSDKADVLVKGRYLSIGVAVDSGPTFQISGFDVGYELGGPE